MDKPIAQQAPARVDITFVFMELGAEKVMLCGDFNGWSRESTPLKRSEKGHWETTLALAPGRYQYKFLVDGEWIPDPLAQDHAWNQHGTLNSVVEVRV